jgi:pimeloyl-ACP methyl ester carboxylesterase
MTPHPTSRRSRRPWLILCGLAALAYLAGCGLIGLNQRSLLYFPSHSAAATQLRPWSVDGEIIGFCRTVTSPQTVWLMTHGNGGQAADRAYVLPRMSATDSLYVLEYPGYGLRSGGPSKEAMNAAALAAYRALRNEFPAIPVCVLGESIGSGPASYLGSVYTPPDKIILVVPFDSLANVAAHRMPFLPVRLMLHDNWDNIAVLQSYAGPVEIYGAINDAIIPFEHAKNLAAQLPTAKFIALEGGHNDWSTSPRVRIER